ncbi:MAG: dicarboxylate/amino acid:cation symporter [Bacteroidetes bacterium]|nr:MAG: dicarboxylate/amino acid:cation symporter [Bacteroidota bacterium]
MKSLPLHWKIIIAMFLGVAWALFSGTFGLNDITKDWLDPFGKIFINCLKFIAIPLVLFSIVSGVAGLGDPASLGKMGLKTLGLYLVTTVTAITLGLIVVNLFQPGIQNNETKRIENRLSYEIWANKSGIEFKDEQRLIDTADPKVLEKVSKKLDAEMSSESYQELAAKNQAASTIGQSPLQPLVDIVPENLVIAMGDGKLMLQVIFFALFFGISLSLLPHEKVAGVKSFFDGMNEVFVKMVHIVMMAAPFFVFCLMAGVMAKTADTTAQMLEIFKQLGMYALVVISGLLILLFGFYPMLLKIFGVKISYTEFFKGMSPAMFLAFSTSSSAATLPVTIECVENNLKVPKKVTDFVLPIGATVNMDGTSLYQAVAVIFLAQYHDVDLNLMQQIGIIGTATLASIGAAAVPSAGLIMLMIVLSSVGLNPLWVALVLPVDRILDMCRTTINVTSDATVSAIVARLEEK